MTFENTQLLAGNSSHFIFQCFILVLVYALGLGLGYPSNC